MDNLFHPSILSPGKREGKGKAGEYFLEGKGSTKERVVVGDVWEGGCECTISTGEGGEGLQNIWKGIKVDGGG